MKTFGILHAFRIRDFMLEVNKLLFNLYFVGNGCSIIDLPVHVY